MALHQQAVAVGLACDGTAGALDFLSLANRALTRGARPGALLTWLLRGRKTDFITVADEEAATRILREHHNGPDTRRPGHDGGAGLGISGGGGEEPPLSEEERVVEACIRTARQHRIRDPFHLARRAKGWTRQEWDDAYLSYELAQKRRWMAVREAELCS